MASSITLVNTGGLRREFVVLRAEPGLVPALVISWGIGGLYTLDIPSNQLVRIHGNRIVKRYQWKAADIEEAKKLHKELKCQISDLSDQEKKLPIPMGVKTPKWKR